MSQIQMNGLRVCSPLARLGRKDESLRVDDRQLQNEKYYVERLRKQRCKIEEMKAEFEDVVAKLQKRDESVARLTAEVDQLRKLQEYKIKYQMLSSSSQKLDLEYRTLAQRSHAMKQHIDRLEAERAIFSRDKCLALLDQNQLLAKEVQGLQSLVEQLDQNIEQAGKDKRRAQKGLLEEINRLKDQVERVRAESARARQLMQLKLSEMGQSSNRVFLLQDQNLQLRNMMAFQRELKEKLQAEMSVLGDEYMALEKEHRHLSAQLNYYQGQFESANELMRKNKHKEAILREDQASLEQELELRLRKVQAEHHDQIDRLQRAGAQLKAELVRVMEKCRFAEQMCAGLREQLHSVKEQRGALAAQLQGERRKGESMCRAMKQMQQRRLHEVDKFDQLFNEIVK